MLSESEIEKRRPIWNALSDLFLDTELNEHDYEYIAIIIVKSGYGPQAIHDILWNEVLPAVGDNLRVVAGEWGGFDPDWLKDRILAIRAQDSFALANSGLLPVEALIDITKQEWSNVCRYLPSSIGGPLMQACSEISSKINVKHKKWWHWR